MTERSPSAWLASIAEIFDDLGLAWTLVGALAANAYRGEPRFTTDLDTMAEPDPRLVGRLSDAGYEVAVIADQGDDPHLLRCHRGPESVDILLTVVEYQRIALNRSVDHVLTAEDVVVHKLIAWRPRDRDDIRSIVETGIDLDMTYLDHWIGEWELADRWGTFDALDAGPDESPGPRR